MFSILYDRKLNTEVIIAVSCEVHDSSFLVKIVTVRNSPIATVKLGIHFRYPRTMSKVALFERVHVKTRRLIARLGFFEVCS